MPLPEPLPLLSFAVCALVAFMFGLVIAAQFPAARRDRALRSGAGALLLWASCGVAAALTVATITFAAAALAWPYAVIAAGLAFLAAPFGMHLLPLAATEGRLGLAVFSAIAIGGLVTLQVVR